MGVLWGVSGRLGGAQDKAGPVWGQLSTRLRAAGAGPPGPWVLAEWLTSVRAHERDLLGRWGLPVEGK